MQSGLLSQLVFVGRYIKYIGLLHLKNASEFVNVAEQVVDQIDSSSALYVFSIVLVKRHEQ